MDAKQIALEVLAEVSEREVAELEPELDLVADLEIDSPKALQLLVLLEERLGIEIPDEDAARLEKVGDVIAYVT
ncbi:MAG: acyl carrier protein [Planctomycetota bacterium]